MGPTIERQDWWNNFKEMRLSKMEMSSRTYVAIILILVLIQIGFMFSYLNLLEQSNLQIDRQKEFEKEILNRLEKQKNRYL